MTQPTISAERIEEMLAGLEGRVVPYSARPELMRSILTELSALRAQARGSEAVAAAHIRGVLDEYERNTCTHETTHRGGSIWTICDECGRKWADDEGGFVPYSDPPKIAAALAFVASPPVQAQPQATNRDALGRRVREAWVKWAMTQPNHKPSWLVPYDELSEPDKEADRQIGGALATPPAPVDGPTHRHVKRGTEYVLIGIGKMQTQDWYEQGHDIMSRLVYETADMAEVAIYRSVDDGSLWARPREEFEDGRFEALTASRAAVAQDETP